MDLTKGSRICMLSLEAGSSDNFDMNEAYSGQFELIVVGPPTGFFNAEANGRRSLASLQFFKSLQEDDRYFPSRIQKEYQAIRTCFKNAHI